MWRCAVAPLFIRTKIDLNLDSWICDNFLQQPVLVQQANMRVSFWYSVQLTAHVVNSFLNINNFDFPLIVEYPQVDVQVASNTVFAPGQKDLWNLVHGFWMFCTARTRGLFYMKHRCLMKIVIALDCHNCLHSNILHDASLFLWCVVDNGTSSRIAGFVGEAV